MVAKNGTALPIRLCISRIHTALESKGRERRDGQVRQPLPAVCGFPAPGCRSAVAAFHRQRETMYTAFGDLRLGSEVSHALAAVLTKPLENP
jgi:hypothetical protein